MKIKVELTKEQYQKLFTRKVNISSLIKKVIENKIGWVIKNLNRIVEFNGSISNEDDEIIRKLMKIDEKIKTIEGINVEEIDDKVLIRNSEIEISDEQEKILSLDMDDIPKWTQKAVNNTIRKL